MKLIDHKTLLEILKPKRKLTAFIPGGGMMGCDSRLLLVSQGPVTSHDCFGYSEPRGRKKYILDKIIERGALFFDGHHPKGSGPRVFESEGSRFIMDGRGGRFWASEPEGQIETLVTYLAQNCLFHTLDRCKALTTVWGSKDPQEADQSRDIRQELLEALPTALEFDHELAPPQVTRKSLLTEGERQKLLVAGEATKPLVKIFNPQGASTWLLCALEADQDTLWAYCDLGRDCVEFGTVSLKDLETTKGHLGLHFERDKFFDGCDYSFGELTSMSSIPTNLRRKEGAA